MKDAVEPTALLLEEEEDEPDVVEPVLETEDWGAEEAAPLEVSLPIVPEPVSEPVLDPVSESVLEPATCAALFC